VAENSHKVNIAEIDHALLMWLVIATLLILTKLTMHWTDKTMASKTDQIHKQ
jgi:hypothetical protein